MTESHKNIKACLETAQDQRSRFIVTLPSDVTSIRDMYTSLDRFDQKYIYLEASALNNVNPKWINQTAMCYFKLVTKRDGRRETFFNFRSPITGMKKNQHGVIELQLAYPLKISIGQRRSSIRIEIDENLLTKFFLWDENRFIKKTDKKTAFNKPLISVQDIKSHLVKIVDISAGGVRIRISNKVRKIHNINLEKGHYIIIWMTLHNPEAKSNEGYWIKGKIQHKYEDFVTKNIDIGVEFVGTAIITADKKMKWTTVKDNNVEPIGNWAFQRYLEQYRKGLF